MAKRGRKPANRTVIVDEPVRVDGSGIVEPASDPAGSEDTTIDAATVKPSGVDGNTDAIRDDGNGDDRSTAEQPRRRGRPPGSGNKKAGAYPLNVRGLEKLLVGIHGGIAMLVSSPGFSLDTRSQIFDGKTEAEFLAQSIADVARHYNPKVFEQKTIDWTNLIQCLALVYGPRIYNIRADMRANKARHVNPKPSFNYGPKPVDPQPAANRAANGHQTPSHSTPVPPNDFSRPNEHDLRTGHVPGVGDIEVPPEFFKLN